MMREARPNRSVEPSREQKKLPPRRPSSSSCRAKERAIADFTKQGVSAATKTAADEARKLASSYWGFTETNTKVLDAVGKAGIGLVVSKWVDK